MFVGSEADDQIFDESSYSYLETGDGNDTIVGGFYSLSSVYDGGSGDDQYFVNSMYVTVYEDADNGYDVIYSSVPLYDIENQSIEEVQFARNATQLDLIDTYARSFEAHLGSTFLSNDLDNLIYAPLKGSTLAAGGDDVIYTYGSTSYVNAGDGDDYVIGYGSKGEFDGGAGNDIIMGGYGNEIAGGLGNDLLLAGWASTVIYTGNLSDYQFYEVYDPDFSSQLALLFVEDSSGIDAIIYDLGDGLTLRFNDQEVEQDNQIFSSYLQVSDPLLSSDVVDAWFEKPLFNLLSDAQIKGDPRKSDL